MSKKDFSSAGFKKPPSTLRKVNWREWASGEWLEIKAKNKLYRLSSYSEYNWYKIRVLDNNSTTVWELANDFAF